MTHFCEQKRRYDQRNTPHGRLGFSCYATIKKITQGKSDVSEEEFRHSDYYLACLRWSRYAIESKCINPMMFLSWLLSEKIPIDTWANDNIYEKYLHSYILREKVEDALDRNVQTIFAWSERTGKSTSEYFSPYNPTVINDILRGAITGWIILQCESGKNWVMSLDENTLSKIFSWINPTQWGEVFDKSSELENTIKDLCGVMKI